MFTVLALDSSYWTLRAADYPVSSIQNPASSVGRNALLLQQRRLHPKLGNGLER